MAYSLKEKQIVFAVTIAIALYDFFTIPFYSFIVACVFAATLYYLTKSVFVVAFVFFIPQIIHISNQLLGRSEGMANSTNEITERIKSMKNKYSTESFTNAIEISERNIDIRNKNTLEKVKEVSGIVDTSMPSDTYPIEGTPSYPNFMNEGFMGTNLDATNRIETVPEEEVPAVGTVEKNIRASNVVENYDSESVNSALAKDSSLNLSSSNMKSVDMTM